VGTVEVHRAKAAEEEVGLALTGWCFPLEPCQTAGLFPAVTVAVAEAQTEGAIKRGAEAMAGPEYPELTR
jgi:hypothetical protein